jgi:hypothetical protein
VLGRTAAVFNNLVNMFLHAIERCDHFSFNTFSAIASNRIFSSSSICTRFTNSIRCRAAILACNLFPAS